MYTERETGMLASGAEIKMLQNDDVEKWNLEGGVGICKHTDNIDRNRGLLVIETHATMINWRNIET